MIKKSHFILLTACMLTVAMLSACRKDDGPGTPFSKITGKWKKAQYATDDNANGILDDWEIHDVDNTITNTLEFKKDSTGIESTTSAPELYFNWRVGGDVSLIMEYGASDTVNYQVKEVNASRLNLVTDTKFGLAGYYYRRTF